MKNINDTLIGMAAANVAKLEGTLDGCKKALANCEFCYNDLTATQKRNKYGKFLKSQIDRLKDKIFRLEEPALYAANEQALREFIENTHI